MTYLEALALQNYDLVEDGVGRVFAVAEVTKSGVKVLDEDSKQYFFLFDALHRYCNADS